jgi:hypothetical protein
MIIIKISTGNSAFEEDKASELARLFDHIARHLQERQCLPRNLYDANGNLCGTVEDDCEY